MPVERRLVELIAPYGEAATFLEAERIDWLRHLTSEAAREIFEQLYMVWERGGYQAGGDWGAIERLHREDGEKVRLALERVARHHGLR